uniref:Uncharacterized protein n=1 Tax=Tanacetum cinerariifolium TaxID=118510 RepID=A0A699JN96_TANCI|nr:hypothetical protein [Tanacetum cinerariifolium]
MGESLSLDRVFDFPEDETEPHLAYDFFTPRPLLGYAGNPNNNGWLEADDYLLGELEAMANEPMAVPGIEEVTEPVDEAEEEQGVAIVVDIEEEQIAAPVMDMVEDLAALFGEDDDFEDDDFSDEDSEGVEEEEVWVVNEEGPSTMVAEGPSFPLPLPGLPIPPSVIEDLSTCLGNLEYGHGQLVKKVIQVSDAEVAAGVSIREIDLRIFAIEGHVQVMASQMVHAADRWEQVGAQAVVQQRNAQIQQLQTMVSKTSSRESTLMQCIVGLDRRLAELERRPP